MIYYGQECLKCQNLAMDSLVVSTTPKLAEGDHPSDTKIKNRKAYETIPAFEAKNIKEEDEKAKRKREVKALKFQEVVLKKEVARVVMQQQENEIKKKINYLSRICNDSVPDSYIISFCQNNRENVDYAQHEILNIRLKQWEMMNQVQLRDLTADGFLDSANKEGQGIRLVMFLLRNFANVGSDTTIKNEDFVLQLEDSRMYEQEVEFRIHNFERRLGFRLPKLLKLKPDSELLGKVQQFLSKVERKELPLDKLRVLLGDVPLSDSPRQVVQRAIRKLRNINDGKSPLELKEFSSQLTIPRFVSTLSS